MMVEAGAEDPARGRHGRGDPVRPPLAPAAHRPPGAAPRGRRQAQEARLHRARHGLGARVRRRRRGRSRHRRGRRRDHRQRHRSSPTSSRSPPSRSRRARSPTAGRRSSTPARPIVGNQMHGITDEDVARRRRAEGRCRAAARVGPATRCSSATTSASTSASCRGARRQDVRAGHLPRHARPRPRGLPDGPESYKLGDLARFFGIELQGNHRALPDAEATAELCSGSPHDLPGAHQDPQGRHRGRASARRRKDTADAAAQARGGQARRRASARACSASSTRRPSAQLVLDEGIRMDGRGLDDDPADHGRGRPAAARPRLRPVHPRRDAGADVATLGAVLGRPADRHDQPGDREALHPPLQHAALQHRREQADARPRPARDRPRRPRRARPRARSCRATRSSRTSSGSCRSA